MWIHFQLIQMSVLIFRASSNWKNPVSTRPYELRLFERTPTSIPGVIFLGSEQALSCRVADCSPDGAKVIVNPASLKLYAGVVLYLAGFGRFRGIVVRKEKHSIGLHFLHNLAAMKDLLKQLTNFKLRNEILPTRLRLHLRAEMPCNKKAFSFHGSRVTCGILNISSHGASLATEERPPVGSIISYDESAARVVRHHANGVGIFFLKVPGQALERLSYEQVCV